MSFPEKLWMIFVRSDLSINIFMSGNLFPVQISLLFFANSSAYTHTYFFFQAPAAMALKLHCNKVFPWTQRERKYKKTKMKQQNTTSNTHFIRVCIKSGLERDRGGQRRWVSCRRCHSQGCPVGTRLVAPMVAPRSHPMADPLSQSMSSFAHSPLHLFLFQ